MKGYNAQKKDWRVSLSNVSKQYKNTIHDSTKLKPVDARQDINAVEVKTNLMLRARFKRKHEDTNVGDLVKFFQEKTAV